MPSLFNPPPHARLPVPSPAQAMALGEAGWKRAMELRAQIIAREKWDPLRHGYEPPIWTLCDCLLDVPWVDRDLARRVREALGFTRVVKTLLILGGNRGGKSQYSGRTVIKILLGGAWRRAWQLHNKRSMGVTYQQPVIRRYMPPGYRKKIKEEVANINYSVKNGFTEGKFVLPNGSEDEFLSYEDDPDSFEGGELDVIAPDELVPPELVETFEVRLATRDGIQVITFTPVRGYSATVRMFDQGSTVAMESLAYLAPNDTGAPDVPAALGISPEEMAELLAAAQQRPARAATAPQSRPEDVIARALRGELVPPGVAKVRDDGSRELIRPDGRRFALVPRVARCAIDESNPLAQQRAIVWFHSSDNPYGNPKNVVAKTMGKSRAYLLERFYGKADKLVATRFPKFGDAHLIDPKDIPPGGTRVHMVDPSTGRNFFMLWAVFFEEEMIVYREWPGDYEIPGHGIPGPWALPDGKKDDGKPGPAQESFGFGFRQYKEELARLEGWKDYERVRSDEERAAMTEEEWVKSWSPEGGAREKIHERCMDSRFASQPKLEGDRPVTLLTDFEKWGLIFHPVTGHGEGDNSAIREGVIQINALLQYDSEKPVDYFNRPKLRISKRCKNLIYAMQNWTGNDGTKGACKDPIDCLRYLVQGGYSHLREDAFNSEGGGHY